MIFFFSNTIFVLFCSHFLILSLTLNLIFWMPIYKITLKYIGKTRKKYISRKNFNRTKYTHWKRCYPTDGGSGMVGRISSNRKNLNQVMTRFWRITRVCTISKFWVIPEPNTSSQNELVLIWVIIAETGILLGIMNAIFPNLCAEHVLLHVNCVPNITTTMKKW